MINERVWKVDISEKDVWGVITIDKKSSKRD